MRALPGIRPKALTKAVRSLEEHGLIARDVYAEVPARVEYSLSDVTKELIPVLLQIQERAMRTNMPVTRRRIRDSRDFTPGLQGLDTREDR